VAKALKLSNLTIHDLLHDVTSAFTMAEVPQQIAMQIFGHKDPRMT
jgi:hypothetical protein